MKKHSDYITHINNSEDRIYLKRPLFPVNIRLFKTSPEYKAIILQQCDYIRSLCLSKMEGYKKPHGMSSANAGLAFNIIGFTINRGTDHETCKIMINPIITKYHGVKVDTETNCGSLTLDEPIKVKRYSEITVEYFNEQGISRINGYSRHEGAFTIQHEVDHNLGILITDHQIK